MCTKAVIIQKKVKLGENRIESDPLELQNEISSGSTVIKKTGDKRTREECGIDDSESPTKKLRLNSCDSTSSSTESETETKQNVNDDNESDDTLTNVSEIVTLNTSINQISNIKEKPLRKGITNIPIENIVCDDSDSNENNTRKISDEKVKDSYSANEDIVFENITVDESSTNDSLENCDNETDSTENTENITSENSEEHSNPSHKQIVIENITFADSNEIDEFDNISCDENSSENNQVKESNENVIDGNSSKENETEVESNEKESLETSVSDESMKLPNSSVIRSENMNESSVDTTQENGPNENITDNVGVENICTSNCENVLVDNHGANSPHEKNTTDSEIEMSNSSKQNSVQSFGNETISVRNNFENVTSVNDTRCSNETSESKNENTEKS
uniref:Uncharacterized protein n=2 Tax=Cacopsylla melanoneura TaxID=428564 RepID=A0A8D9EQJ4_9HEMI